MNKDSSFNHSFGTQKSGIPGISKVPAFKWANTSERGAAQFEPTLLGDIMKVSHGVAGVSARLKEYKKWADNQVFPATLAPNDATRFGKSAGGKILSVGEQDRAFLPVLKISTVF